MTVTDWLPMAADDRLNRAERWLACCTSRLIEADSAFQAAQTELQDARSAYDSARSEYERIVAVEGGA